MDINIFLKKYCASTVNAHGVYALLWIMFVKVANIVFLSIKKCDSKYILTLDNF